MDLSLTGKVALVCAASRGLGRAIALELAAEGAQLVICARNVAGIAAVNDEIIEINGDGALGMVCDVSKVDDLDALVDETCAVFGQSPDIVVWNSGGPPSGATLDLPREAWQSAMDAHLFGALHLFRRTLPGMMDRGWGRLIGVTSLAVKQPISGLAISNTVRAGLTALMKTLSLEVAGSGITVNTVLPGYTDTDRLRELARAKKPGDPEAVLAAMAAASPAGRLGRPEELAAAVAFLASERAGFINGVALPVDGGASGGLL